MNLTLTRFAYLPEGVLGKLLIPTGPELFMLERPWRDNKSFLSCIPEGKYGIEWDTTGRIKNTFRLRDTAPRTQINIHPANIPSQLHGCIAPGMSWEINKGIPRVNRSKAAMGLLIEFFFRDLSKNVASHLIDGDIFHHTLKIESARAEV